MFAIASVANVNDVEPATHSVAIILAFGYPARYAFIRIVFHFFCLLPNYYAPKQQKLSKGN